MLQESAFGASLGRSFRTGQREPNEPQSATNAFAGRRRPHEQRDRQGLDDPNRPRKRRQGDDGGTGEPAKPPVDAPAAPVLDMASRRPGRSRSTPAMVRPRARLVRNLGSARSNPLAKIYIFAVHEEAFVEARHTAKDRGGDQQKGPTHPVGGRGRGAVGGGHPEAPEPGEEPREPIEAKRDHEQIPGPGSPSERKLVAPIGAEQPAPYDADRFVPLYPGDQRLDGAGLELGVGIEKKQQLSPGKSRTFVAARAKTAVPIRPHEPSAARQIALDHRAAERVAVVHDDHLAALWDRSECSLQRSSRAEGNNDHGDCRRHEAGLSGYARSVKIVRLSEPSLGALERRYIEECIDSGQLTAGGPFGARLEEIVARHLGLQPALVVATTSGTSALTLALLELGVGPEDEVVVPQLSYVAPANAAACLGARLLFAAVEPETGLICAAELASLLEDRVRHRDRPPKAVIGVDLLGRVASWSSLLDITDRHGCALVEDACEALGATGENDLPAGRWGHISCLSFNGTKTVTGGAGGAIRLPDRAAANRTRMRANHGRRPGRDFVHERIGDNCRISNLHAAIATAQMERLGELVAGRRRVELQYRKALEQHRLPLAWLGVPPDTLHLDWLPPCLASDLDTRERVLDALGGEGVEARPFFEPLHRLPPFTTCPRGSTEAAEDLASRGFLLPSSSDMSDHQIESIVQILSRCFP